jgi:hypothetical protein
MTTSISQVNVGVSPNDGTGDSIRSAFLTVNNNFSYLTAYTLTNISNNAQVTVNYGNVLVNGVQVNSVYSRKLVLNSVSPSLSNVFISIPSSMSDGQELRITSLVPITSCWINMGGLSVKWASNTAFSNGNVTVPLTFTTSSQTWMTF